MNIVTVHGIRFKRKGRCKRCGACEKSTCRHYTTRKGKATCLVYGRSDYLTGRCDVFPDSPFCRVVLEGRCAYRFIPLTHNDAVKYEECLRKWQLTT